MGSFKYKLARFMSGRYGSDKLNRALLITYLVLWGINLFVTSLIPSIILDIAILSLMAIVIFRMMSRNIYKRRMENEMYIRFSKRYLPDIELIKCRFRDRHTHVYKKCPSCKSVLRLRKIKGEHTAICPKCRSKIPVRIK